MEHEPRHPMELELQERVQTPALAHERMRSALQHASHGIISTDIDGVIGAFNPAAERLFGYACQEVIGRKIESLLSEPLHAGLDARPTSHLVATQTKAVVGRRKDGSSFAAELTVGVSISGNRHTFTGFVCDITHLQQQAKVRDAMLSRLQSDTMPLAYVLFGPDFRVADWSPAAERIFGYSRREMLGAGPPYEQFVPRSFWRNGEKIVTRLGCGDMDAHSINENLTKDGRTITCQWFNTPMLGLDGTFDGFVCLAQDVTEQTSLNQRFHQARNMEAIGLVASGVAHDFNNIVTVIKGYSQIISTQVPDHSPVRELAGEINAACERATALTRQLSSSGQRPSTEKKVLNLNDVIAEAERNVQTLIGARITLSTILAPALGTVQANQGQIEEVIINLVLNARDAMPQGGQLTLTTADVDLIEADCLLHPELRPGKYVMLSVSDNGTGMDQTTLAHLFEPFFTTKPRETAIGLGLATVFELIKQNDGSISVDSQLGYGTTFKIYLPLVSQGVGRIKGLGPPKRIVQGAETILLADDKLVLRTLSRHILTAHGYSVLDASNAAEVRTIANQYSGSLHLLITDVVMPETSGPELAEALLAIRPGIKVLYVSGYSYDAIVRRGYNIPETAFLQRPFTSDSLAAKVRDVLDNQELKGVIPAIRKNVGKEILVIDDDEHLQDLLQKVLETQGYTVRRARNGRSGLREYRSMPADLVICEIFMADQDGLETIRQLQQECATVKIIAVSGGSAVGNFLHHAKKFGAVAALEKPFSLDQMLASIQTVLQA